MEYIVKNRKPANLFKFFEEICTIPHGSFNTGAIADYLVNFARERGLFFLRDEHNNVLIRRDATEKFRDTEAVLLQGHTDMVCEKNSDTVHDFMKDPLKLKLDGRFLYAEGTTLGGDDGAAVAMMLAFLDGETLPEHPTLECLFTSDEEVGLLGAGAFDFSAVSARKMINLDSECESEVIVGCAGGIRSDIRLPIKKTEAVGKVVTITVKGLMGGHSGSDINLGRTNANKLMGRLLDELRRSAKYNLVSVTGGSKDNAIPRECSAVIATNDFEAVCQTLDGFAAAVRNEIGECDAGLEITASLGASASDMFTDEDTKAVVDLMNEVQDGVVTMSPDIEGFVEYSRNFGIVRTSDDNVLITVSSRSANESQIDDAVSYLSALAGKFGGKADHHSRYPGWSYQKDSALRDKYVEIYREYIGKEPSVKTLHAGLECGVIKSKKKDMDMISIGPDMYGIHSPDEKLDLDSVERVFAMVSKLVTEA